jgi:hypothetical protein
MPRRLGRWLVLAGAAGLIALLVNSGHGLSHVIGVLGGVFFWLSLVGLIALAVVRVARRRRA